MDQRVLIGAVFGLVLVAFGGFYFALSTRFQEPVSPSPTISASNASRPSAPQAAPPRDESRVVQTPAPPPAPASPAAQSSQPILATPGSIEAEIAMSDYADLQTLLKTNFAEEYGRLMVEVAQIRNTGISDQELNQTLFARFQDMLRPKLKLGVGASTPAIDRLAANEAALFHALGVEAAPSCMKLLGKDGGGSGPLPNDVNRLMRLGTLLRFRAVVEGMANPTQVEELTRDERVAFEEALKREGLRLSDVSSGAFLTRVEGTPGQPCLALERLHKAIASLSEATRRKIYAGMFFLGRG